MASEVWVAYAGQEVVNNARAKAYCDEAGVGLRCGGCPGLAEAVEQRPWRYTRPDWDDAPWFDPSVPESAGVLGFAGLRLEGLGSAATERAVTQLLGDGAVLGPLRRPHREVTLTLLALAVDRDALSYGLAYLASLLRGDACGGGSCGGGSLCFFAACPSCGTAAGCGDAEQRVVFDVGLLEGPDTAAVTDISGGVMAEVEVTWAAAQPFIYRRPLRLSGTNVEVPFGRDGFVFVDPTATDPGVCDEPVSCLDDPTCPPLPLPPRPPVPRDPCFPAERFRAARTLYRIPSTDMPEWLETVPLLQVTTGSRELRKLMLRFHVNPTGRLCGEVTGDPCAACSAVAMTFLPAGSTLTVDGRVRRAWVDCPGGTGSATAEPVLYGPGGGLFQWPVFPCPVGLCVEVLADEAVAGDARALVEIHPRQDAA